jgi:hypothetical protein
VPSDGIEMGTIALLADQDVRDGHRPDRLSERASTG